MIESLFGYHSVDNNKNDRKRDPSEPSIQYIQIINPRKAQNLSILLRALNVTTEEVLNALQEGDLHFLMVSNNEFHQTISSLCLLFFSLVKELYI
jgi:hypothetical protein